MAIPRRNFLTLPALVAAGLVASAPAWAGKEVITFAGSPFASTSGPALKAWVQKFNDSQDKIEVQPVSIGFSNFANAMFTQIGGGGGPDLIRFDLNDFYPAVAANLLLPLDGVVDKKTVHLQPLDRYLKIDGKRYGVAFEISPYALIVNKALLKGGKPPGNFDEFLAAAKAATGNGVYGFAYRTTLAESAGFWQDLCNFVYGFGGSWSDGHGKLTVNSRNVVKAVAAYKKVYDLDVTPKGANATTYRHMFGEGKVAMEIDNGAVMDSIRHTAGAAAANIIAVPSPFPVHAQSFILAPLTVNANTKHKEAAFTFIRWMLQPANQKTLLETGASAFVATDVVPSPEDLARQPWRPVYSEQIASGKPQLVVGFESQTPEMRQIILEHVVKVLQTGIDPQAAMNDAQKLIEHRVLHK